MAENNNVLERRLSRLEIIVAALLVSESSADFPKEFELFLSRLLKTADKDDEYFWKELLLSVSDWRFPRRYWELNSRIKELESRYEEIGPLSLGLSEELSGIKQRLDLLAESNNSFQNNFKNVSSELREKISGVSNLSYKLKSHKYQNKISFNHYTVSDACNFSKIRWKSSATPPTDGLM